MNAKLDGHELMKTMAQPICAKVAKGGPGPTEYKIERAFFVETYFSSLF